MIVTGADLKQAREAMGWSPLDLAKALRLSSADKHGDSRIQEMEAGARPVSGPVAVAVESFLRGYVPMGFEPPKPAPPAPAADRGARRGPR